MIATNIVRSIDENGTINIPKKVRLQAFGTEETKGMTVEFFYEKDGTIILKPVADNTSVLKASSFKLKQ